VPGPRDTTFANRASERDVLLVCVCYGIVGPNTIQNIFHGLPQELDAAGPLANIPLVNNARGQLITPGVTPGVTPNARTCTTISSGACAHSHVVLRARAERARIRQKGSQKHWDWERPHLRTCRHIPISMTSEAREAHHHPKRLVACDITVGACERGARREPYAAHAPRSRHSINEARRHVRACDVQDTVSITT
jgi:hypothetical protein